MTKLDLKRGPEWSIIRCPSFSDCQCWARSNACQTGLLQLTNSTFEFMGGACLKRLFFCLFLGPFRAFSRGQNGSLRVPRMYGELFCGYRPINAVISIMCRNRSEIQESFDRFCFYYGKAAFQIELYV